MHVATAPATRPILWIALLVVGTAWGATQPLAKVAVSTGFHPFGILFWQNLLGALLLTALVLGRGGRLPLTPRHMRFYAVCGVLGTVLPHSISFLAARHLPAGIISILMATVPMMTLLVAALAGRERPGLRRIAGLALGAAAVVLIAAPDASLADTAQALWVLLPLCAALCYAMESTWIDAARPAGMDPVAVLCGMVWAALALTLPLLLVVPEAWIDPLPLDAPRRAMILMTVLHIAAYSGLIWLIGRAGPVFATQVGYVVMGAGVVIGMIALGERHGPLIWLALPLMAAGVAMVKPRRRAP